MSDQSQAISHPSCVCDGNGALLRPMTSMLLAFVLLLPILSALGLTEGDL